MSIRIIISQALSEEPARRLAEVSGTTIGECLDDLAVKIPKMRQWLFDDTGQLREHVDIFINRNSAFPNPLKRPTKDGDEIHILSIIGGG